MSVKTLVEKIDIHPNTRKTVEEPVAMEAPVNVFVNDHYVITLLATPELKKELAVGWLFDEGILHSFDDVTDVVVRPDVVTVVTNQPVREDELRVFGVSRLLTTACGLTTQEFYAIIEGAKSTSVESKYTVRANVLVAMAERLDEGKLFRSTGGVHVAALYEDERLVAMAEDVGRHNTIDKVIGIGILSEVNFANSVLVSSGRQPADMVLKAARIGIPIVVSEAAPIRSGIIAAKKTGITLACFVRDQRLNVYTHSDRILIAH